MKSSKFIYFFIFPIIFLALFFTNIILINPKEIDMEETNKKIKEIHDYVNLQSTDPENNKSKILKSLETEKDSFERGKMFSALVTISNIQGEYDNMLSYGEQSILNYKRVKNGDYYAILEGTYLAISLSSVQRYYDCFKATNNLMEMINLAPPEIIDDALRHDTEVVTNILFLTIYSQLNFKEAAEIYYNKLNNTTIRPNVLESRAEAISFSKFSYATAIDDSELMMKYAKECYYNSLKADELNGTNFSDSLLINVAILNIMDGNVEEGLIDLKKSQLFFEKSNNGNGIATVLYSYALYYQRIGDVNNAYDYYVKCINQNYENKNYLNAKKVLEEFFIFSETYNFENNINSFSEIYYNSVINAEKYNDITELADAHIKINEDLNNYKLDSINNRNKLVQSINSSYFIVIIILLSLLTFIYILLEKNKSTQKKLNKLLNEDYLTGSKTRAHGLELIGKAMDKNLLITIAILDLDNFKKINDTYGHLIGDEVLKYTSSLIISTISKDDIFLRFGGEEFVLAFINKDISDSKAILEKIKFSLKDKYFDNLTNVSFSAGMAAWTNEPINTLLSTCDSLLYKAKENGKDRIET